MNTKTRMQILKICGPLLLVCGFIGFFFVMYADFVEPKDAMITMIFFGAGAYFTWLSRHPEQFKKK